MPPPPSPGGARVAKAGLPALPGTPPWRMGRSPTAAQLLGRSPGKKHGPPAPQRTLNEMLYCIPGT